MDSIFRQSSEGLLFLFGEINRKKELTMYGKPLDSIGFVSNFDPEIAAMMGRKKQTPDGVCFFVSV